MRPARHWRHRRAGRDRRGPWRHRQQASHAQRQAKWPPVSSPCRPATPRAQVKLASTYQVRPGHVPEQNPDRKDVITRYERLRRGSGRAVRSSRGKGSVMSTEDKAKNKGQELKGKVKETTGRAVGNERLEAEGVADQTSGNVKQAGEKIKDAGKALKP